MSMTARCPGCYRPDTEGYCRMCRKLLFNGQQVHTVLPFDTPTANNLESFQDNTKHLSISGAQLKYSLKLMGKELAFTDNDGQYILKPIPPSTHLVDRGQAPENEHLTMQIATSLFGIPTAPNCLIYFKDGTPAYLTQRFDVKPNSEKHQQEDMAQLSSRSYFTHGDNFKYEGTYEEVGQLIQRYVAAYPPALERFFRQVVFNYLFSNGDAHMKNFSLIRTAMGDYTLTPAYDLISTVLHSPLESDTAMELYPGSMDSPFYRTFGYYGLADFKTLADRLGIIPIRRERIMSHLLSTKEQVLRIIRHSFLTEDVKEKYIYSYKDKLVRMTGRD
jgi:serine/threonine-protein kinase HipA